MARALLTSMSMTRFPLCARRWLVRAFFGLETVALAALLGATACGSEAPDDAAEAVGAGGGASGGIVTTGGVGTGGLPAGVVIGAIGGAGAGDGGAEWAPDANCAPEPAVSNLKIAEHAVVSPGCGAVSKVFYTWTSAEQEAELRAGGPLYSVGEVAGKGRGLGADLLFESASAEPDGLAAKIAPFFETCRYAWPNPWATLLGTGEETYGDRLLQIVLKDDAWIGVFSDLGVIEYVMDLENHVVTEEQVAAHPERIAGLFFVRTSASGGPICSTFTGGEGGYREFILANQGMVKSYSIGTEEILVRLKADEVAIAEYLQAIRANPPEIPSPFNAGVSCSWGRTGDPYLESLAIPSDPYRPTAENLGALVDALQKVQFSPIPFTGGE